LNQLPKVSILVAARNEETNIKACLDALLAQNYPSELLEIWVGNDHSEDATASLVQAFADRFPHIFLFNVERELGQARGKANVLAHLAERATGQVLLIADADVRPNPNWVENMLKGFDKPEIGLVNGTTLPLASNLFQILQAMDWLLAQAIIRFLHLCGVDYTAVGNNMAISKTAYEATGGYENIPFSITEDLALYEAAKAKGFSLKHLYSEQVLATTLPMNSWSELMQQRVRWMHGAGNLPLWQQTPLFLQMLFLPGLVLIAFQGGFALLFSILAVRWALFSLAWGMLGQWRFLIYLPLFELYAFVLYWHTVAAFYARKPVVWKGRTYSGQ